MIDSIKMEASTIGNCAKSLKLKPSQIKPLVERLEKGKILHLPINHNIVDITILLHDGLEGIVKTSGRGVFELNLDLPESDDLIDTQQSELYQAEQTPKDEPVHFVTPFAPSKKLGKSAMTNCASEPPSRILDDIEESYTDDVVPFLRNTRGKRTREDPVPKVDFNH